MVTKYHFSNTNIKNLRLEVKLVRSTIRKLRWQIKDRSIKDDLGDKADKEVPEKSKLKFLGILSAWQMTNRLTKSV